MAYLMDHIRQFDWCAPVQTGPYFIDEADLDNSNIEKILRNRFHDPLISSDEDDEPNVIDWDEIFKSAKFKKTPKIHVPGMKPPAPYPKLSSLTGLQHFQCLKVLCANNPEVLEGFKINRPTQFDRKSFEALQETYEQEKKEYIEWAKSLWVSQHCVRALRPKPYIETMYEAEFKVKAHRVSGYSKQFDMAAQIPLECTRGYQYEFKLQNTLLEVNASELPQAKIPQQITENISIINACSLPEPCHKHPYQFILPTENSMTILPIKEVHRELAQYAVENNARFIASENALSCLMEFNRYWTIPVSVCSAYNIEGEKCNVVVLDSEFSIHKEPAMMRTFKAFTHLLENAFIPTTEIEKIIEKSKQKKSKDNRKRKLPTSPKKIVQEDAELSSDDEPLGLAIIEDYLDDAKKSDREDSEDSKKIKTQKRDTEEHNTDKSDNSEQKNDAMASGDISVEDINDIIGVYSCTCTDTLFEVPPRRSFKKWRLMNKNTNENLDVIVHCSHKARHKTRELILEPIPEYQLELGASQQPPDRLRSLALALMLRKNASVVNVRVDGCSGDVVSIETVTSSQHRSQHPEHWQRAVTVLHSALAELQGLVPGDYLLRHEPSHGSNALLYVARPHGSLPLHCDMDQLVEPDEAKMMRTQPILTDQLLPYHKFRKMLPCAFTPFDYMVTKETKKPPSKQKTPPQALKWPKRRNRRRNKK